MMEPLVITGPSVSLAWARVFLALLDTSGGLRHPAIVSIDCADSNVEPENQRIRALIDRELMRRGLNCCATIAGTIFPVSMWNPSLHDDAEALYRRYNKAWPGISKCPANRNGVYFRRLTAFEPNDSQEQPINQLQFITNTYRHGNHRKSALQASILDPRRDHTNQRQKGFPCLQQVAFTPLDENGMSVTGFYATQYQFEKAYGNYLGLHALGVFMAKQLGLRLTKVVCVASVLKLGGVTKTEVQTLANDLRTVIQPGVA